MTARLARPGVRIGALPLATLLLGTLHPAWADHAGGGRTPPGWGIPLLTAGIVALIPAVAWAILGARGEDDDETPHDADGV